MRISTYCFIALLLFVSHLEAQQQPVILFTDDFSVYTDSADGSPTWHPVKGAWKMAGGAYRQESGEYDCASMLHLNVSSSFELEAEFEHLSGDPGVGFIFSSYEDTSLQYAQMVRYDGVTTFLMGYFQNGEFTGSASAKAESIRTGERNRLLLKVERDRGVFSVSLNGAPIQEGIPLRYRTGYVGLQSSAGQVQFHSVTLRELPTTEKGTSLEWIKNFSLTQDGHIIVPDARGGAVGLVDGNGTYRPFPTPSTAAPLMRPTAAAEFDDSSFVICDAGRERLSIIGRDGRIRTSADIRRSDTAHPAAPVAVRVDEQQRLFVVDQNGNRVLMYDTRLQLTTAFGEGELRSPMDIALENGRIYVLNTGLSQVECFERNGEEIRWTHSINYGGGEARGIAVHNGNLYITVVNQVRCYDRHGTLLHVFDGRALNGITPWGIAISRTGEVLVSDFAGGRIVFTTLELLDPTPSATYDSNGSTATITWKTTAHSSGTISLLSGGTEKRFGAPSVIRHPAGTSPATAEYTGELTDLTPGKTFRVRFNPVMKTLPVSPAAKSNFYPFTPPAGVGEQQYARLPMAVILFTDVIDTVGKQALLPAPPPLAEKEIERVKAQIADAVKFYWIHSGFRFFIDTEFIIVPERRMRSTLYGSEWWYPPREDVLAAVLEENGRNLAAYTGILYLTFTQAFDSAQSTFALLGKGGAFTNGVGTGKGYGISWWDVTREHHNAGNNWLVVHEFNHQLDDIFLASGYPEYWFNHISPTIGTAAKFGEHFDANGYILRIVPPQKWLDLRYTELRTFTDSDRDGVPDNDPALPLDEARLESDNTKGDSDADGVADYDEILSSSWLVEGWGETYGGKRLFPSLRLRDSDGDGFADGDDPFPAAALATVLLRDSLQLIGELHDPRIDARFSGSWNEEHLTFLCETDKEVPLKLMIDAEDDGWFCGRGNYLITLDSQADSEKRIRLQMFNATDPRRWPYMDSLLAAGVQLSVATERTEHGYRTKITIPASRLLNTVLRAEKRLGLSIGFVSPLDEKGNKRAITLFEPNRFFSVTLR